MSPLGAGYGFDVTDAPADHAKHIDAAGLTGRNGTWMRVRGLADPELSRADNGSRTVEGDRAALRALRMRGIKTAVHLRWAPGFWVEGVRKGGGNRLPLDLREIYKKCRVLSETYGDLVDVWEIENEPDIGFVADNPETYAAFHKAVYLGLHGGIRRTEDRGRGKEDKGQRVDYGGLRTAPVDGSNWPDRKRGWARSPVFRSQSSVLPLTTPRVVMAPLALPPGPYLERLWANGIASYIDGFNFHYYGYAEDFTGVYRQFENAVSLLSTEADTSFHPVRSVTSVVKKNLPVFITEYGYGLLDADTRNTVEGRVRQWRWFANVAGQLRTLRPEGPMAFVFNPFYEASLNEFGLSMAQPSTIKPETENVKPEEGESDTYGLKLQASGLKPQVSPIRFTPSDFGSNRQQPWMIGIGKAIGDTYASPALAYLWDHAQSHPYQPRAWNLTAAPPSPVVVDFIADNDLLQIKVSGGYRIQGASAEWTPLALRTGRARLVLYNFSAEPITGDLEIAAPNPVVSTYNPVITLVPGERREIPLQLSIDGGEWKAHSLKVRFSPRAKRLSPAVFTTALYPAAYGLVASPIESFAFKDNQQAREQVRTRPLASEEPRLYDEGGRWLATDGVHVEEQDGLWRIHIDHLADTPLRPAAVELPLPRGFVFPPDTVLNFGYRVVEANKSKKVESMEPAHKPLAGAHGDGMTIYIRTANGNLYFAGSRLSLTRKWLSYAGRSQDFTMGFFGRAALPWRFADNTPVSLFIYLRPAQLPTVFEIRNAQILRFKKEY